MSLEIRAEAPADFASIRQVVAGAFGRAAEADLVDALRAAGDFDPRLSRVALFDGQLVAHVLFSNIAIDGHAALALAPLAVSPAFQRRGAGAALVREGLERCRELGHTVVIVLGEPEYYSRFGFAPAERFAITPPFEVPSQYFMALELAEGALSTISGVVRYAPAFAAV